MNRSRLIVFAIALLLSAAPAPAWDAVGHMLVDDIAQSRLQPEVKEKVLALAQQVRFPGHTYNVVTLGCWMDDLRTTRTDVPFHGRFKPWHFIDIGIAPGDPVPSFEVTNPADEAEGNVVQALKRAVAVLRGGSDPLIPDQPTALAIVMHLVGDIHQPLHCATYNYPGAPSVSGRVANDRGGNEVKVLDSPVVQERHGPWALNLHAFWDEAYRARFENGQVVLEDLYEGFSKESLDVGPYRFDAAAYAPDSTVSLQADFDAWAHESHQIAQDNIYGALTFNARHDGTRLSADDVAKARELAKRRIVLAGYRLAALLNDLLGSTPPAAK